MLLSNSCHPKKSTKRGGPLARQKSSSFRASLRSDIASPLPYSGQNETLSQTVLEEKSYQEMKDHLRQSYSQLSREERRLVGSTAHNPCLRLGQHSAKLWGYSFLVNV